MLDKPLFRTGAQLKFARLAAGMSIKELGELGYIPPTTIRKLEKQRHLEPSPGLEKVSALLIDDEDMRMDEYGRLHVIIWPLT